MPPRRIPQTRHIKDAQPDSPDRTKNISTLISATALAFTVFTSLLLALLFLLSCSYINSVEKALQFFLTDYVDFVDYVQFVPIDIATKAAGTSAGVACYALLFGVTLAIVRPKLTKRFVLWVSLFFLLGPVIYIWSLFRDSSLAGDTLRSELPRMKPSTVFRKGEPSPIKGILFLHSNRYLFLWISDDNSVVAIPNMEVQMVQTPSYLPLSRGTTTPITPSPTTTGPLSD